MSLHRLTDLPHAGIHEGKETLTTFRRTSTLRSCSELCGTLSIALDRERMVKSQHVLLQAIGRGFDKRNRGRTVVSTAT